MTERALGIIAGGGGLPAAIGDSVQAAGRPVFVAAITGSADSAIAHLPHEWVSIGEPGKAIKAFKAHDCSHILMAGQVARPRFGELKLDAKGMMLLPKVIAAARKGDDAILRCLVDSFEKEGFQVSGVAEAAPGLLAPEGALGAVKPNEDNLSDIALAARIVRAMGEFDIGQAAAVCEGLVLAVEAAEGTDAMIARVAGLPENLRGVPGKRRGVLVKALKPTQDGKTDLPVIGTETVKRVAAAGLAGIAVEAGNTLLMNRAAVAAAADAAGLFVYGFPRGAYTG
jgi:hypothetical protein